MTDTTTTPDDTQPTADTTPPGEPETPPADETDDGADGSGREAKLRKRAQAAEAERDQLREQVEALQRQQVEQLVTAAGIKPAALFSVTELAELLAEDGTVDAELVTEAIGRARDELGVTPVGRGGPPVSGFGDRPSHIPRSALQQFSDAFAPKRR